jgi:hypothetical protein
MKKTFDKKAENVNMLLNQYYKLNAQTKINLKILEKQFD